MSGKRGTPMARFWPKVHKTRTCWNWIGSNGSHGYGQLMVNGRPKGAHRLSYEWAFGKIPRGLMVCHRCDNKRCVRPSHLFLGTAKDNLHDALAKGVHIGPERRDRCLRGHELTVDGSRQRCITCERESQRKRRARKKAA